MKNGMQVKKHLNTCMDVWTCMNACIDGWIYTEWFRLLFMFTASIMQDELCLLRKHGPKMIPNTNIYTIRKARCASQSSQFPPLISPLSLLKAAGSGRFAQSMGVVVTKVRVHRVVDVHSPNACHVLKYPCYVPILSLHPYYILCYIFAVSQLDH